MKQGAGGEGERANISPVTVGRADLVDGFQRLGIEPRATVLVHSAMRTLGYVEGGGDAVVDALLAVIGPDGTLVVPTFTFAHEATEQPVIDPAADPSEMGTITEALRARPEARRSTAYRHSVAAIGAHAEVITAVDPTLSPFDLRSAFGVMLALDTQVVLLGMTYSSSTSHHLAEFICQVPYRQIIMRDVRVRGADGTLTPARMTDYQPISEGGSYYGSRGPDFSRLGRMLEERGAAGRQFIGNAAVRRYGMRDLFDLARAEAARDYNIFRTPDGQPHLHTPLDFGVTVLSPELTDGAGRTHAVEWCVRDPTLLVV